MKIISINAGSSSLKFKLYNMDEEKVIAKGNFERIGLDGSFYTITFNGEKIKAEIDLPNQKEAVRVLIEKLIDLGIITSLEEIDGIGHRIVAGGDKYSSSVLITDEVIEYIDSIKNLAPLHNPEDVEVIRAFKEVVPNIPMVAVFDTSFHKTMEKENFLYPIPYSWYEKYQIRKYGAHGTSYRYIVKQIEKELGRTDLKIIGCHLGSGGSVCAIKDGKSIDTSMGFTPLAGIMMGTRSGDIDPSIIPYIMEKEGKNAGEIIDDLNHKSGLLGMSQISSDARDIEREALLGDPQAILTQEKYAKTVVSYISNYYVELEGADVIIFTAGIGENSPILRSKIINKLSCLGIKIDENLNQVKGEIRKISTDDSKVLVYVIPTDEELIIAKDTLSFVQNR